jgi:cellulose 1,4-beta-cellobiosidase
VPSTNLLTTPLSRAALAIALLLGGALLTGVIAPPDSARAATTLCGERSAPVSGGYVLQNDEFNSSAAECVTTDGGADFTVTGAAVNTTGSLPGAYPSIFSGCHWGDCSTGGLGTHPVRVSALSPGTVTSSWTTRQSASGTYDVAYDMWTNQTPRASGYPDGSEIMIWLNHSGSVSPAGSKVASDVNIGGRTYDIWYRPGSGTPAVITYVMTRAAWSVVGLDVGQLVHDSANRGYTSPSWYLIDVEAGFELWQGGTGLSTSWFQIK